MNSELIARAEAFSKRPHTRKRASQFDKWKDVISYLKNKELTNRSILEFILQEDTELAKKYKDREPTAYALLTKYIKKHFNPDSIKPIIKAPKISNEKEESSSLNDNQDSDEIDDETKQTLINHYGKDYIDIVGYRLSLIHI